MNGNTKCCKKKIQNVQRKMLIEWINNVSL